MGGEAIFVFFDGFGDVNVEVIAERGAVFQIFGRRGIDGMGADSGFEFIIILAEFMECVGF